MKNKKQKAKELKKLLSRHEERAKKAGEPIQEAIDKNYPNLKILSTEENPDGSMSVTYETNEAFDNWYKRETGSKRVTKKGLGAFITERFSKVLEESPKRESDFIQMTIDESEKRKNKK
jgi:hypothetical protein